MASWQLLRGQLAALAKTGSQLPVTEDASSLTESLRTGKLISASSTLRAVQTALHAAPEGLLLVEHSLADTPLESLVSKIRPSLVLIVRPTAPLSAPPSGRGWADSMHDVEARQAYELRALEAMGDDAPHVRLCGSDVEEASQLIYEFISRVDTYDDGDVESDDDLNNEFDPLCMPPTKSERLSDLTSTSF